MRKFFVSLFVIIIMIVFINDMNYAQCPPPGYGCNLRSVGEKLITIAAPECFARIQYEEYECPDGSISYKMITLSVEGICKAMRELNVYHHSLSSLDEMLSLAFIEAMLPSMPNNIPCGSGPVRTKIYTANCGIWVGCKYEVDPESRLCDPGYDGPPYPDNVENGVPKVKVYKWQPCGTTCCERSYEICDDGTYFTAKYLGSVSLWADCTEQSKYSPRRCQTGCD